MIRNNDQATNALSSTPLLERWELYRSEMCRAEKSMAKLAKDFLELGAYEDASKCAIKAAGLKFIIGRMPSSNDPNQGRVETKKKL